jgi:hypothetical protein
VRPVLSIIPAALVTGFLAGHGVELVADILPLLLAITIGFLLLSATDLLGEQE